MHACNPSYLEDWGRRIAWTWEAEIAVSQDHAIALQPGQQKWDSISKNKKQKLGEVSLMLGYAESCGYSYIRQEVIAFS